MKIDTKGHGLNWMIGSFSKMRGRKVFGDTKGVVIRRCKSKNKQLKGQKKNDKKKMVHKALHIKLKIGQHWEKDRFEDWATLGERQV